MRINRFLASCGLGSRRKVEELVSAGEIQINGEICRDLSRRIDPESDEVRYQGKTVEPETEKVFIVLNKPPGYVVSQQDEYSRKTVYDLLPEKFATLPYAGRLDRATEGLLLFTNDGNLINQLTHPSYKVEKVYRVELEPRLPRAALNKLRSGVEIEGGLTQSAGVYVRSSSKTGMNLKMVITEGRKRQIRQMVEAVGGKVIQLKRLQFGPLLLKDLPLGRWRLLSQQEIRSLYYVGSAREMNKEKR